MSDTPPNPTDVVYDVDGKPLEHVDYRDVLADLAERFPDVDDEEPAS